MRAIHRYRMPPMVRRPLKYSGANPAGPNPSLSDVMTSLSQIQQNQTQIMNTVGAILANQTLMLICESSMAIALAPNQAVSDQVEDAFQTVWAQLVID